MVHLFYIFYILWKGGLWLATFITTVNIVVPIFLLVVLGALLRRVGILDAPGCAKMNTFSFDVLVPAMVFYNIYEAELSSFTNPRLLLFCMASVSAVFLVLMVLIPRLEKDRSRVGVIIQGIFRSSFVVLGMGLAASMYPGQDMSIIAIASTVVAPLFNAFAVIALEVFSSQKPDPRRIALGVVKNPLIIASVLALLMLLTGLRLPYLIDVTVQNLSACATTVSLVVLGGSLSFAGIGGSKKQLAGAVLGKMVVLPLIFIPLAVWMGFRDMELLCVLILFASPSPVTAPVMARNVQGADWQLAGQIVVFSTTFSILSLFCFIYALLSLGLL